MSARPEPPAFSAGTVTGRATPSSVGPPPVRPSGDPARRERRRLLLFGGAAAGVLAIGLAVALVVALGGDNPFRSGPVGPVDGRPPLAQRCPPPSGAAVTPAIPVPPPADPGGRRTVDEESGISYAAYGAPWLPWRTEWRAGTLRVPYRTGQHFVTETYSGGTYHASILSAAVPAADNDVLTVDLECIGRQISADVRAGYYPQPNRMEPVRAGRATLGGRPAWVSVFRLHFKSPGLTATDELAAVACVDVGRATAAVLYVSIPGTHRQYDWVVDDVLASVRPV